MSPPRLSKERALLGESLFLSPWTRLLRPLSMVYGNVALSRRRRLETRAERLPVPVISVGNITVGGTGKTPVVEWLVRDLGERDRRPAILSRGYRGAVSTGAQGEAARVNDEYLVLEQNLPGAAHIQDADRLRGGRRAIADGADVLVLDDGFQHVRLARDLNIVLLDAINPFGFGRVLPAGLLREPLEVLGAADLFVLTRLRLVNEQKARILRSFLRARFQETPCVEFDFEPRGWVSLSERGMDPVTRFRGASVVAFAGIGNPRGFFRELIKLGITVVKWIPFPDHHRYTRHDMERIKREAESLGAAGVVMTQKDAVKIPRESIAGVIPWAYLKIESHPVAGEDVLRERLDQALSSVVTR